MQVAAANADRGAQYRGPVYTVTRTPVIARKGGGFGFGAPRVEPKWMPSVVRWGANGALSTCQIDVKLGRTPGNAADDRAWAEDRHGTPGDDVTVADANGNTVFTGIIGQQWFLIQSNQDAEAARLTAYGPELLLSHKALPGPWYAKAAQDTLDLTAGQGNGADQLLYGASIRDNIAQTYGPCVLNPDGYGNASASVWKLTSLAVGAGGYGTGVGNACKVFVPPGRRTVVDNITRAAAEWTPYTALRSVIEWLDNYEVIDYDATDWRGIEQLFTNNPAYLRDIDLTGCDLLECMKRILNPAGFGFALEPWTTLRGKHRLLVFHMSNPPRRDMVFMPNARAGNVDMDGWEARRAQVQRIEYLVDQHNVQNHIVLMGDTKRTERVLYFTETASTRDLHPYWNTTTYDLNDYDTSNEIKRPILEAKRSEWDSRYVTAGDDTTAAQFASHHNVFRTFAWNEDGALSSLINAAGVPYIPDISAYGSVHVPRPIGPRVKYAKDDASLTMAGGNFEPATVEVGICKYVADPSPLVTVDNNSWVKVQAHIHTDRAAITLTCRDLAAAMPWANNEKATTEIGTGTASTLKSLYGRLTLATLLHNTLRYTPAGHTAYMLRIRVTGTIPHDDAITADVVKDRNSSWPFDSQAVVHQPSRWKYRDVLGVQKRAGAVERAAVDDLTNGKMTTHAQRLQESVGDATGSGSLILRGVHTGYRPGDGIEKIMGRNIHLGVRGKRGLAAQDRYPIIVGVTWQLSEGRTELVLETPHLRQLR